MARLSSGQLGSIKINILKDLYGKSEEDLEKRKTKLAQRNRQYVMDPLEPLINQLPKNLFIRNNRYELHINYNIDQPESKKALQEKWVYTDNSPTGENLINPKSSGYYNKVPQDGNLVPELQQEAKELCEDIIKIRNEKKTLENYLDETTAKYTGTKQLRKVWPNYLHKYLPVETPKGPAPKVLEVTPPNFIQARLTSNLLEK